MSCLFCGGATALFGAPLVTPPDAETHLQFVVWLGGALLIFVGCTTSFVALVIGPAVDKRFAKHLQHGATDHQDLVSKAEWLAKHDALVASVAELGADVKVLLSREAR